MSSELNPSAYKISWELDHLEYYKISHDAELIAFPGSDRIVVLADTEPFNSSNPIMFRSDSRVLNHTDFPENDVNWPIMSSRMLEVLQAVGNFPHHVIPIIMASNNENLSHDFIAVQLTTHLDIFDYERSRYRRRDEDFPELVIGVREFVINVPPEGLPPLFRLSAYDVSLFISSEAREALRVSSVKGMAYIPLHGYRDGKGIEIDIPVPVPVYS